MHLSPPSPYFTDPLTQTHMFPSDRREFSAEDCEYFYNKEEGVINMDGETPLRPKVGLGVFSVR